MLELAKQSYGLVVPESLHQEPIFSMVDLEEDSLLRITSVEVDDDVFIHVEQGMTVGGFNLELLQPYEEQLRYQWVKLVPANLGAY